VRGRKTIAISRDLLQRGWKFGDRVYVKGIGECVVWDLTNPRLKNTIDVALYNTRGFATFESLAYHLSDLDT
jgi:3D (Asp-Asp-Asp) domain-containing protein